MKTFLNLLALLTLGTVAGSNIYWQWANAWVACIIALIATFGVCLIAEKIAIRIAYRSLRKEHGKDWK